MLKIFYQTTDISNKMLNYIDQTQTITLTDAQYIYVGYKKPINALYVAMSTVNTSTSVVDLEFYNGSTWATVVGLNDKTQGLVRSNWLIWDRNQIDEAETTINSIELYWYRISVDVTTSAVVYLGINLLLSDDLMIKEVEPHLLDVDFYPNGYTSFIPFHQSARSEIIQRLRNEGKGVYDGTEFNDLTVFDLLDFTQLSEASKYYALSQIYFNLSDSVDDKYWQKFENYLGRYNNAFKTFFLSIDENDDGKQSEVEKETFRSGIIIRV
jgi:hypothetical protein